MNTQTLSTGSFNLRLKLFVAAVCCALTLVLVPAPAHAAGGSASFVHAPVVAPGPDNSSFLAAVAAVPFTLSADSLNLVADQVNEVNAALVDVVSSYAALFSLSGVPQAAAAATVPTTPTPIVGESLAATIAYMPQSLYETAGKTTDFLAAVEMAPLYVISDALSEALFKAGLY